MSHKNHTSQDDDSPRHVKRAPKHKDYGIATWSRWHKSWVPYGWYASEKARDQALKTVRMHTAYYYRILGLKSAYRELER